MPIQGQIVQENVSVSSPVVPSQLQRSGAIVSQGGTTKAVNSLTWLPLVSSLTGILAGGKALTSLTWTTNVATGTTTAPHGWTNGDVIPATITGVTPAAYNVADVNITITGASTFTYPLLTNPGGSATVQGVVTLEDVAEITAQNKTYFAQGTNNGVYVLELGEGTAAEGVTALSTWITANPGIIYSWLVPFEWDGAASFITLMGTFTPTNAKVQFYVTTTSGTYTAYPSTLNCMFGMVQAPGTPTTEFSCAAPFAVSLGQQPSSVNNVTPLGNSYLYGVTAYPLATNGTILTSLNNANVNVVGTGAEGGLPSNLILIGGNMMDGNPWNFWYAVDWVQINVKQALANEVITGANNKVAPLLYNQPGVNRLQRRGAATLGSGVTNGLILGTVLQTALPAAQFVANFNAGLYVGYSVINAEPFSVFTAENPSDYALGIYGGMTCVFAPLLPFQQIIVNIDATEFV